MNIRRKCIEAMAFEWGRWVSEQDCPVNEIKGSPPEGRMLDAALAVLADPENWTPEMTLAAWDIEPEEPDDKFEQAGFAAVINHVREQKG